MPEHPIPVTRSARYYTLDPTGEVREVWFVLHGYGQRAADFLESFEAIQNDHRLIVAPEALSRFYLKDHKQVGASWMTREDREAEISDYVAYLDAVYDRVVSGLDRNRVRVVVLGFSQGGTTASRWAVLGQSAIDRLILWAGDVAHDLDLDAHHAALSRLGLTFVVGSEDTYITPERLVAQETLLIEHSIPYRLIPFSGGHHLKTNVLQSLAEGIGHAHVGR